MKRREFITLLGGAAAAWPVAAGAQQGDRVRRIGVVTSALETDADLQALYAVLRQALQQLGWTEGRNIQFDRRLGSAGDSDVVRRHAQELVALAPDLIVASGSQNVAALQQEPHRPDCVPGHRRPGWRWVRRQSCTPRRQHNRLHTV